MNRLIKYGLTLLILTVTPCFAQNKRVHPSDYDLKQQRYQAAIQQYWYSAPDSSIILADSALMLAQKHRNLRDIAYFNLLKGVAFYYQGLNRKAIVCLNKALLFGTGVLTPKLTANVYNMLSLAYRNMDVYDSALYNSKKALALRMEKVKDSNDIAGSYDNLSTIYTKLGACDSAINYSMKAARIFEKTKNRKELAYVWGNLSNLYNCVSDEKNTFYFSKKVIAALKMLHDTSGYAEALNNIGDYYLKYGKLDSALLYLNKAAKLYLQLQRYTGYATTQRNLGRLYLLQNRIDTAQKVLTKALDLFSRSKQLQDQIETELLLSEVALRKNHFDKAEEYLLLAEKQEKQLHIDRIRLEIWTQKEKLLEAWGKPLQALALYHQMDKLRENIAKKELESKLEELGIKYKTELIISENKKLKQQQEIEIMRSKQMRLTILIIIVVAMLVVSVLFALLQKRKRNMLLQKQKLDLIQKEEALIKTELENTELKKQELIKENKYHVKQLTTYTLHMMQKNLILQDILTEVKLMEKKEPRQIKKELVNLKIQLINALSSDTDWENFKFYFEKVNANFFVRLREKYPNITPKDERLCALIRLNLSLNEAASVLNVDYNTVRVARYRLRKKMGLKPEEDLYQVIRDL